MIPLATRKILINFIAMPRLDPLQSLKTTALIEYKIINLTSEPAFLVTDQAKRVAQIDQLLQGITNEPVELRGKSGLFFVFTLFLKLKNVASEITYRPAADEPATVIYSILDESQYIRPYDVSPAPTWTEPDLKIFKKDQDQDKTKIVGVSLSDWWQTAQESSQPDPLAAFLDILYRYSPHKREVKISQNCPLLPALMVLNWFVLDADAIRYEDIILQ